MFEVNLLFYFYFSAPASENSGEDLTAARKFQMDANGRKFENRVAAWRESVGVVAGLHLIEHAMTTMNKSS